MHRDVGGGGTLSSTSHDKIDRRTEEEILKSNFYTRTRQSDGGEGWAEGKRKQQQDIQAVGTRSDSRGSCNDHDEVTASEVYD